MTGQGIDAHAKTQDFWEKTSAAFWATRFDEVIVNRSTLPTHAYQRAWSDIPQSVKDKAVNLMKAWSDDQTLVTQGFWEKELPLIIEQVLGRRPGEELLTSTEVPVL